MIVENFGVVIFDGSEISFGQFLHLFSENLIASTVCDGVAPIEERNVTEIGGNRPTSFSIGISFQREVFDATGVGNDASSVVRGTIPAANFGSDDGGFDFLDFFSV